MIETTGEMVSFEDDDWSCTFTLLETDPGITYTIQQPLRIGKVEVELSTVCLSPISVCWEYGKYFNDARYGLVLYEKRAEPYSLTLTDGSSVSFQDYLGHYSVSVDSGHT